MFLAFSNLFVWVKNGILGNKLMSRLRGAERQAEKLKNLKEERRKLKGDRGALIPNKQTNMYFIQVTLQKVVTTAPSLVNPMPRPCVDL